MALEPLFLDLIQVYRDAYQALLDKLTDQELRGLSTNHTRALLSEIDDIIAQLKQYQRDWINHTVSLAYQEGSDAAVDKLTKRYRMTDINISFGSIHTQAVNAIVRDTFNDVAAATDYMAENLKQAIRDAAKEKYRIGLITGETRRSMTKGLTEELNRKGFTAYYDAKDRYIPLREYANILLEEQWVGFIDKAGRRWDLMNYSEMLCRTKVLEASNRGTENRLTANNLDLVLITSHGASDWCRFFEGKVFSISGQSSEYPPLSEVPNHGCPMHPRCRHSESPFIEKFESEGVIQFAKETNKRFLGLNREDGRADQAALRKLEKERKGEQNRVKYGIIKSTRYPSSQQQIAFIMRNELKNVKFSADVLYNPRLRCVGKTTALEKYGIIKIQKIEIGKQDKQGKAELIDTMLHEELEARIMIKAYNRNSKRYQLIGKHQELTTHTYINKVIKRFFRFKGWTSDGLG